MMRFGIPEYRLPRTLIRAEIDKILALGVTLKLRSPLSPSFGLAAAHGARDSSRSSSRSASRAAATCRCPASSWTASSRRSTTS